MSVGDTRVTLVGIVNRVDRISGTANHLHVHLYMNDCPGVITLRIPTEQAKHYVPGSTVYMETCVGGS